MIDGGTYEPLAGFDRATEVRLATDDPSPKEGLRLARGLFLDELPGIAFGLITIGWIAVSLLSLA